MKTAILPRTRHHRSLRSVVSGLLNDMTLHALAALEPAGAKLYWPLLAAKNTLEIHRENEAADLHGEEADLW